MLRLPSISIRRPQKIAALLLLAFAAQVLYRVAHVPLDYAELRTAFAGTALFSGDPPPRLAEPAILVPLLAGALPAADAQLNSEVRRIYAAPSRWLVRLPFAFLGVWLGGALWWVARRLFSDAGGYAALALFCFSPLMISASATAATAVIVAWGLFGLIYTGIGIGHTLYAPVRKWRMRVLLLGTAVAVTAAASLPAAAFGFALSLGFMLYLAPGKRLAAITTSVIALVVAFLLLLAAYRFNLAAFATVLRASTSWDMSISLVPFGSALRIPAFWIELLALVASLVVFAMWQRARYFGNLSPLLAFFTFVLLAPRYGSASSGPFLAALPFAYVFTAGIWADLLEARLPTPSYRRGLLATGWTCAAIHALLALLWSI